ncbi:L-carnitine dehydrogenase [Rhodoplanes serenus]|uniref:L-carnitine dehydrogenase n=2 Tax=Nitrobacteraceae TaxID=41294 RepID=A0A3S4BGT9_9BRAD|nr:thioesterase family protein [Rhodovulum sp.]VCU09550.1 L-carnitine dehydrogenase [Rhodoplanes serenus]
MNLMIDHSDLKPVFFAPFVSSVMRVETEWIDYNGHLNMAYYNVLFDRAADEVLALIGAGLDYVALKRHSYYTAETHLRYLRELKAGDAVRATVQLLDHDAKRLHYFQQLFHAEHGFMAATLEVMALHVDMEAGRTAPAPPPIATRLAEMKAAHSRLPRPEAAGRRIAMPHRA